MIESQDIHPRCRRGLSRRAARRKAIDVDESRAIAVSPRHTVLLATELYPLVEKAPRQDFVVRTRARREANGLPLMTAELVIAGEETRQAHPPPRPIRCTFARPTSPDGCTAIRRSSSSSTCWRRSSAGRRRRSGTRPTCFAAAWCRASPTRASRRSAASLPRTTSPRRRSCRWRPRRGCGGWPRKRWRSCSCFRSGGLAHGDAELHNIIVCPAPLEPILIDFEAAVATGRRWTSAAWEARCEQDLQPLLREAVYLQCALGRQPSPLGERSWNRLGELFRSPDRFRRAIETAGRGLSPPRTLHGRPANCMQGERRRLDRKTRETRAKRPRRSNLRRSSREEKCLAPTRKAFPCRPARDYKDCSATLSTLKRRAKNHERKHGAASSDHGSNQLQARRALPSTTRRAPRRRCSGPTSSAWPR